MLGTPKVQHMVVECNIKNINMYRENKKSVSNNLLVIPPQANRKYSTKTHSVYSYEALYKKSTAYVRFADAVNFVTKKNVLQNNGMIDKCKTIDPFSYSVGV